MTLEAQALKPVLDQLSQEDKRELASYLLEESGPDIHPAWKDEIRRRMADVESGAEKGIPASEVMARLKARFQ